MSLTCTKLALDFPEEQIGRFAAELIAEHMIAQRQAAATGGITNAPPPKGARPHPPVKRVKPKPSKSFHAGQVAASEGGPPFHCRLWLADFGRLAELLKETAGNRPGCLP